MFGFWLPPLALKSIICINFLMSVVDIGDSVDVQAVDRCDVYPLTVMVVWD